MKSLRMKVANPPKNKALMLYDGDCSFCRRSAFWLRGATRSQVDFASWRLAIGHFPEIHPSYMEAEAKLITPNGNVYGGAEAVFKALSYGSKSFGWTYLAYEKCPPFRWFSEMVYRNVARNRQKYSKRVGPFWIDWDSGGEKYEIYQKPRSDKGTTRNPTIPPFGVATHHNEERHLKQKNSSSSKKQPAKN